MSQTIITTSGGQHHDDHDHSSLQAGQSTHTHTHDHQIQQEIIETTSYTDRGTRGNAPASLIFVRI